VSSLRRRGTWAAVVVLGVGALVAIALATATPEQLLDPEDRGPSGGRALVETLRSHGVHVEVARSLDEVVDLAPGRSTTVVVADPGYLGVDAARELGEVSTAADRLVLLSPTSAQLAALDVPLVAVPGAGATGVVAGCDSPVARTDDVVEVVDVRFLPTPSPEQDPRFCFGLPGGADEPVPDDLSFGAAMAEVSASASHPEVVAVGFSTALTNRRVDEVAHAGVAIRALGQSSRLVWYQPGLVDLADFAPGDAPSAWPSWTVPAAALVGAALVALAVVRGRRLGALVTEPLPVVVRAAETTESRARLYRRARDRERSAAILRGATTGRLASRLAGSDRDVGALVAVAAAATGVPPAQVHALLAGPPPTTDQELQSLARALADLEERVRTS